MVCVNTLLSFVVLPFLAVQSIQIDVTSTASIKSASSSIASVLVSYYTTDLTGRAIGTLPPFTNGTGYYWWESAAFFDALIQYSHLTGDTQYNSLVADGLLAQTGSDNNFMPRNQTLDEGNDVQGIWGLAAMSAAETSLPLPASANTSWVGLAEAVFNDMAARWATAICGGGLRWQISSFLAGYDYKNSVSSGFFFQLSSRLARFTGNSTYSDWASTAYEWTKTVGYIDGEFNIHDGAHIETNCTDINRAQFSYVAGTYITGVAHMYNITGGAENWKGELDGLLNRTLALFFPGGIANEVSCEVTETCTVDMMVEKGLLGHWLVDTVQLAPYTTDEIMSVVTSSAEAAAQACDGTGCSTIWNGHHTGGADDGGVGGSIDALSYVQGLLVNEGAATSNGTTSSTGGSTTGSGGNSPSSTPSPFKNVGVTMRSGMGVIAGLLASIASLML